jgi:hypothetical protein
LGAVANGWGAFVLTSHNTVQWARILVDQLAHAGAEPVLVLAPEALDLKPSRGNRLLLADPLEAAAGAVEVADFLAPLAQLPALYTSIWEISSARGLNPDVPPNMDYMLELILPANTTEPDLQQTPS